LGAATVSAFLTVGLCPPRRARSAPAPLERPTAEKRRS